MEQPDIPFVTPEENMSVWLGYGECILDERLCKRAIFSFRFVVVSRAAVLLLVADAFVVLEADVVWRVVVYHVGLFAIHEGVHHVHVERIAAEQTMAA